jgi:hypothetical protein
LKFPGEKKEVSDVWDDAWPRSSEKLLGESDGGFPQGKLKAGRELGDRPKSKKGK